MRIVSDSTREFPQFSLFTNFFLGNLLQRTSDAFKVEKVEVGGVSLEELNIFLHFIEFINKASHLINYFLLFLFTVFEVSQCLLLKVATKNMLIPCIDLTSKRDSQYP
jgi:hypothetical protein